MWQQAQLTIMETLILTLMYLFQYLDHIQLELTTDLILFDPYFRRGFPKIETIFSKMQANATLWQITIERE